jgi:hypothetical protein
LQDIQAPQREQSLLANVLAVAVTARDLHVLVFAGASDAEKHKATNLCPQAITLTLH